MNPLQLFVIFCILLFTFTRVVNVRVTKNDALTVRINLNIFAIIITEEKIKKKGFKKVRRLIRSFKTLAKPTEYLLSRTEIRVYKLPDSISDSSIFKTLYSLSRLTSLSLIISYLEAHARRVRFMNGQKNDMEVVFDFSLHFSPLSLIISALLFLYYTVKSKIKQVIKNV